MVMADGDTMRGDKEREVANHTQRMDVLTMRLPGVLGTTHQVTSK